MLVPSPAFRSMALGIMLSVVFILAATLTLLPAVLAKLGPRVDKLVAAVGALRRAPLAAVRRLGASACGAARSPTARSPLVVLVALSLPVLGLQTGMPSIKVVPEGDGSRIAYTQVQDAFGAGAPGALQVVAPAGRRPRRSPRSPRPTRASPQVMPADARPRRQRAVQVVPEHGPVRPGGRRDDRPPALRRCRRARSSAARSPRTTTSKRRWPPRRRWSSASCSRSASCCCSSRCRRRSSRRSAWSPTCWRSAPRSASPG